MGVLGGVGKRARAGIALPCTDLLSPAPLEGWGAAGMVRLYRVRQRVQPLGHLIQVKWFGENFRDASGGE
jgi:hypothetical protein